MPQLSVHPLTPRRWQDFERLFGKRGACGGCWCMWWRLKRSDFEMQKGEANRMAMRALVDSGSVPGIMIYDGDIPIGWCAVAPREEFDSLNRSRILKPVDSTPVWSIVCFFVTKEYRKRGVSGQLIAAAVEFVREQGGKVVEAYPIEPKKKDVPDVFAWIGFASSFLNSGFVEVARRSQTRPIMRYFIDP